MVAIRPDLLSELGQLFRRHRLLHKKIQIEVAGAVGISQPSYSAYECGDALPTVPVFLALLQELDIPLSEVMALLPKDDEPNGVAA